MRCNTDGHLERLGCALHQLKSWLQQSLVTKRYRHPPTREQDSSDVSSNAHDCYGGDDASEFEPPLRRRVIKRLLRITSEVLAEGFEVFYPSWSDRFRVILRELQSLHTGSARDAMIQAVGAKYWQWLMGVHQLPGHPLFNTQGESAARTTSFNKPGTSALSLANEGVLASVLMSHGDPLSSRAVAETHIVAVELLHHLATHDLQQTKAFLAAVQRNPLAAQELSSQFQMLRGIHPLTCVFLSYLAQLHFTVLLGQSPNLRQQHPKLHRLEGVARAGTPTHTTAVDALVAVINKVCLGILTVLDLSAAADVRASLLSPHVVGRSSSSVPTPRPMDDALSIASASKPSTPSAAPSATGRRQLGAAVAQLDVSRLAISGASPPDVTFFSRLGAGQDSNVPACDWNDDATGDPAQETAPRSSSIPVKKQPVTDSSSVSDGAISLAELCFASSSLAHILPWAILWLVI